MDGQIIGSTKTDVKTGISALDVAVDVTVNDIEADRDVNNREETCLNKSK